MVKPLQLLFIPLILGISFSSGDSSNWILKKNANGIAVYTRYAAGSSIKEIRIIDTVKSSLSGVIGVILDIKNYPAWVYRCSEGKTLKLINEKEQYDYELTDVPWPFNDRDVITYSEIFEDPLTKTVTINSSSAPDYLPELDGIIRIKNFKSIYTLNKLSEGRIQVDYTLYADPGGDIPDWLINATIVKGPYNSTMEMVKKIPSYQSTTYSFIKE